MEYYIRRVFCRVLELIIVCSLLNLCIPDNALAQTQVSGQVADSLSGDFMPGVNIVVKGTARGTSADANGAYQLQVESLQDTLVFSFIGYQTATVAINGQSMIDVQLQSQRLSGEELVVVGYGTQRKSDLTGSVSGVKSEDITDIPTPSLQNAIQGKVAGVDVTSQTGRPGSQPVVHIRGVGTLNDASPLYVVDGMLLDDISFLDPQDVQSVEVLKDASATAIFGSRGANGVIVITTKEGKPGATQVHVHSYYGIQRVNHKIPMANAHEFAVLANEVAANTNASPLFQDPAQYSEGFDWQDWLIDDQAPIQSNQISISGGSDKMTYNVSGNFITRNGVIRGSNYRRANFRINNQYNISNYVTFGHNVNFSYNDYKVESQGLDNVTGLIQHALQVPPTLTPKNENGDFTDVSQIGTEINPAAQAAYSHNDNTNFRTTGNVYVNVDFLEHFSFRSNFGLDWHRSWGRIFDPEYFVTPIQSSTESSLWVRQDASTNWLNENTLKYKNDIGDHKIDLLAGVTFQDYMSQNLGGTRLGIPAAALDPNPNLLYLNSGKTTGQTSFNGSLSWGMISYLFRANYSYKDRYLLTGTFRRDGSSRFASKNRWGNFPSAAIGWVISNESFMKDVATISNLKLRGSWGIIGNDKIDVGAAVPTVTSNLNYVLGPGQSVVSGNAVTELANPDLKWEETKQTDVGLEVGLFDDKLSGDFDWYHRETDGILVRVPIPSLVGVPVAPVVNAASVLNTGLEGKITWQDSGTDFSYKVSINATTVYNKVLALGGGQDNIRGGNIRNITYTTNTAVGHPIGAFYGWKQIGIFQTQEEIDNSPNRGIEQPGDIKIADTNEDGVINEDDKIYLGSPIPKVYYGLNFSGTYKNLDLSFDIDGRAGNKILYGRTLDRGYATFNYEKFFLDRWTGPGTSNSEPRITNSGSNYEVLSRFLYNGDFIRLRNVQLGYTLSPGTLTRLSVRKLRFYVSATNVYTLTNYIGYTPQIAGGPVTATGIDEGTYPVASTYTLGIQLDF